MTTTTTTTLAAALIAGVPRYWQASNRSLQPATDGEWLSRADVLSALTAAMDPALSERAGEVLDSLAVLADMADLFSAPLLDDDDRPEMTVALERIVAAVPALLAQNAALRAERDAAITIAETAIAEADTLRAERDEARKQARSNSFAGEGYVFMQQRAEAAEAKVEKLRGALTNLPAVYAHQINTGVREVYDPLQRFYTMESVLAALTTEASHE